MREVEVGTFPCLLDAEQADGGIGVAVFDAWVACHSVNRGNICSTQSETYP